MLGRLLAPLVARMRPTTASVAIVREHALPPVRDDGVHVVPLPTAPTGDARSQQAPLLDFLAASVEDVMQALPDADRRGDTAALLRSLTRDGELSIRQPPAAFQEALAVSRREDVGLGELLRVVERDPVLSRGVLTHASSAFYARGGGACRSVGAAAQRIGAAGMHGVVVSSMMRALLCRPGPANAAMVTKVWEHTVRTASIARDLAIAFETAPEHAYTVGLLHDIGKLVLFDRIATMRTELRRELDLSRDAVRLALRAVHEPLGGLAALRWELGGTVARAIATHHRAPAPTYADPLGELAFVAERVDLSRLARRPLDVDGLWESGRLTGRRERVAMALAAIDYAA